MRIGNDGTGCDVTRSLGRTYVVRALRSPPPLKNSPSGALPATSAPGTSVAGSRVGRAPCVGVHASYVHAEIFPSAPTAPAISNSIAGPSGSHACSSSRLHCTRTGLPDGLRQQRRVARDVVGAVVAVAPRAFGEDHANLLRRHREQRGDRRDELMSALRRRIDRRVVAADVGHGARRADRRVELERPAIRRAYRRVSRIGAQHGVARLADDALGRRQRLESGRTDRPRQAAPASRSTSRSTPSPRGSPAPRARRRRRRTFPSARRESRRGRRAADCSSSDTSVAPTRGGLTTRPCTIPGSRRS